MTYCSTTTAAQVDIVMRRQGNSDGMTMLQGFAAEPCLFADLVGLAG